MLKKVILKTSLLKYSTSFYNYVGLEEYSHLLYLQGGNIMVSYYCASFPSSTFSDFMVIISNLP